jgi:hypothetical protein
LQLAAALSVQGNTLRVQNLTGHKLITGYPEGRRMWLRIQWSDDAGRLLREDGSYGRRTVNLAGEPIEVNTILDPNARVYAAHYGITRDWAQRLQALNYPTSLPLKYNALNGSVEMTLGQLAAGPEPAVATFHFVLNNTVLEDNRIPPYGAEPDELAKRRALPVPPTLYDGGARSFDEVVLQPPPGATTAAIQLLYQSTSWEYIQFLYLANRRENPFLAETGATLLDAWRATGMAEPEVMATATWRGTAAACHTPGTPTELAYADHRLANLLSWSAGPTPPAAGGYRIYEWVSGAQRYLGSVALGKTTYADPKPTRIFRRCYGVTAWQDCDNDGVFNPDVDTESAPAEAVCSFKP